MNTEEMLQFALNNGMLNLEELQLQTEMRIKEQYLAKHPYKIWQGTNGLWYTYLPDFTKGRVLKKRKNYEDIVKLIVEYQKEIAHVVTIADIFEIVIERKLEHKEIQIQTANRYQYDFDKFIRGSTIDNIPFKSISELMLEDYMKYTIAKYDMTFKMWCNLVTIIKAIFKRAKKLGETKINISSFLDDLELGTNAFRVNAVLDEEQVFTQQEEDTIVNYLKNCTDLNSLGILLIFQTGIRIGELVALEFSDITPNYMEITKTEIHYDIVVDGKKKRVYEVRDYPKTPNSIRKVYYPDETYKLIMKIRSLHNWEPYLFMKKGHRITENCIYKRLLRVCDKLGIQHKSPHKIRKTYASMLFDNQVAPKVVAAQLGHKDVKTSLKYYYYNRKTSEETLQTIQTVFNNRGNQR